MDNFWNHKFIILSAPWGCFLKGVNIAFKNKRAIRNELEPETNRASLWVVRYYSLGYFSFFFFRSTEKWSCTSITRPSVHFFLSRQGGCTLSSLFFNILGRCQKKSGNRIQVIILYFIILPTNLTTVTF